MEQERLIFHIDVNSAFLSWEALERLRMDPGAPDLRTVPSAVGGDASARRGVVLAKSTPAKRYGVATGEPLVQAKRKCPSLLVVPSHYELYLEYSRRMFRLLEDYTPDIEKYSIDEGFLNMTDTIHLFGDPLDTAHRIRQRIREELGFTVNVGVAPNKLLAKMASDFEKPDRCHTLFAEEVPSKLWPLPIRELFSVGRSAQRRLENLGIHTIGDLARCDLSVLKVHLGDKCASLLHGYANGIDLDPVAPKDPISKNYGNSVTLAHDVSDPDTARQVILSLSETVGARLRADHVMCGCICVELKDWDFHTQSHQITLDAPTDSTTVIYEHACRLLEEFWDLTPVRLLGVRTSKITGSNCCQLSLFGTEPSGRMRDMEIAVDAIRRRFGTDSIMRASFLQKNAPVDHAASKHKHLVGGTNSDPGDPS